MATHIRKTLFACAAIAVVSLNHSALADLINPLDPLLQPFILPYGDFSVISLQYADTAYNTNAYDVQSSPGQIRSYVVPLTGAGGTFYNDGSNSMDTPYSAPSGKGGQPYFSTGNAISAPDPGGPGQFAGDTANTWDASLSDLRTALNNGNLVFYFNLNETGTDGLLSGTDVLAWGKVSLVNSANPSQSIDFYLAGNPFDQSGTGQDGKNLSVTSGGPDATSVPADNTEVSQIGPPPTSYDTADARWSVIHGDICVIANGASSEFLHYGACVSGDKAGHQTINQNLGADQAAFAFFNITLDDIINGIATSVCVKGTAFLHSGDCTSTELGAGDTTINNFSSYNTLSGDIRLTALDNGYEQIFLASSANPNPPPLPEPSSAALLGTAVMGFGWLLRRRFSTIPS